MRDIVNDQLAQLDLTAPPGAYEIDNFKKRFAGEPLSPFRSEVNRLVQRARDRTKRDVVENPQARRDAVALLAALETIDQELQPFLDGDPSIVAAELLPAFRGSESPAPDLVQIIEAARALSDWGTHLRTHFEIVRLPGPAFAPLPHHLIAMAAKMHLYKLGHLPPSTRNYWLAEFLAAMCSDFRFPLKEGRGDDAIGYWGRKLQEFLSNPNSRPESKLTP
jgi:hypothetical protein